MKLEELTGVLSQSSGNYTNNVGNVYFSSKNIKKVVGFLENEKNLFSILVTPYLINVDSKAVYELHYYELSIEVENVGKPTIGEYNIVNSLPVEITENLNPFIVVSEQDSSFLSEYLYDYFEKMDKMGFESDRKSDIRLTNAKLYYQLF